MAESSSFIAISYSWHSPVWALTESLVDIKSPLTLPMWRKTMKLRSSDKEPAWIDQLSIKQDHESDKQNAIAAMDLIYRSARIVVVVLEDICHSQEEMACVIKFFGAWEADDIQNGGALAQNFILILSKIFSTRWFSRAWCLHEHLMTRSGFVLIPVEG
jgi:hypothetical protein